MEMTPQLFWGRARCRTHACIRSCVECRWGKKIPEDPIPAIPWAVEHLQGPRQWASAVFMQAALQEPQVVRIIILVLQLRQLGG